MGGATARYITVNKMSVWALGVLLTLLLSASVGVRGAGLAETGPGEKDTLSFGKRFSFSTNALDWVLTTPNLGVEFDFSGSPETRFSILINGKYNWNTKHSIAPRFVYNVAAGSVEVRKYWRTGGGFRKYSLHKHPKNGARGMDSTVAYPFWIFKVFRRNVLSGRTYVNPRAYRAYYVGATVGYEKFTLALGGKGRQGDSFNAGFTAGWSLPLYPMRNGRYIDLDLGFSLVAKLTAYDEFGYNEEHGCYVFERRRGRHITPYPVIQDAHIGFVFRFGTIGKKVQGGVERYDALDTKMDEKRAKREKLRQDNWFKRDSMANERAKMRDYERKRKDSIRTEMARKDTLDRIMRDAREQEEAAEGYDGLEDVRRVSSATKEEKARRKAEKAADKARRKEEKERQKAQKEAQKARQKQQDQPEKAQATPGKEDDDEE